MKRKQGGMSLPQAGGALAAAFCVLGASTSLALAAAPPEGVWSAPVKHAVIEVYGCGDALCGRVMDSDNLRANPAERDIHNKDPALRTRAIKGMVMMSGFKGGPPEWSDGKLYDPSSGNTYHGSISMRGPNTLILKGCIIGPLCRDQTWTRIR